MFLIPEKKIQSLVYLAINNPKNQIYSYTHIFCTTGLHSHLTEEKAMPKCQYSKMPSFPLLRNNASSEKQANIFPAACNALEGERETDHSCSENWILPAPISRDLALTSMKEGSNPLDWNTLVPPSFLRVMVGTCRSIGQEDNCVS